VIWKSAVEKLYTDRCTVYGFTEVTKANGSTGFELAALHSDIPCRLSFQTIANTDQTSKADLIIQVAKLFVSPNIEIKAGSRIDVLRGGETMKYKSSGKPAVYATHQEIVLTVAEKEA
jgi:hypothetical protein